MDAFSQKETIQNILVKLDTLQEQIDQVKYRLDDVESGRKMNAPVGFSRVSQPTFLSGLTHRLRLSVKGCQHIQILTCIFYLIVWIIAGGIIVAYIVNQGELPETVVRYLSIVNPVTVIILLVGSCMLLVGLYMGS